MKLLVSIIATLVTTAALADIPRPTPKPAKPTTMKLTQITDGTYKLAPVFPKCATRRPNPCRAMPAAGLVLTLPLVGCFDTAHVSYSVKADPANNDIKVIVSALNVGNPKSLTAMCVRTPEVTKTIILGGPRMLSANVSVEFMVHSVNE